MNRQLRILGVGLLACYVALFGMVNYIQVIRSADLNGRPDNTRAIVRDFDRPRGQIISGDGAVLARTVPAVAGDQFEFQREYPEGDLFGHITGYLNLNFGATGLEKTYNDELAGQTTEQEFRSLSDLFVDRDHTGELTISLRKDVQQVARDSLGTQRGSVVALDPRDGSILALWSFPSYDPNALSTHDNAAAQQAKDAAEQNPDRPLRARTYQERFFPGSTFKVITGAVGVESGAVTPETPNYPVQTAYDPPDGRPIQNFGGSSCGGPLFDILRVSCNSAFAQMGAETVGPERMIDGVKKFGYGERPPIDLPAAASSTFPEVTSQAFMGQASIGQFDNQATPLQMALAAGAIANNGIIMTPHLMDEIRDEDGRVVDDYSPTPWKQAVSAGTAQTMRQAMLGVVASGTATRLAINGFEVGGKTGTAQLGTSPPSSHAWIIGFAGPPGGQPTVAVAVIVEAQPGVSEVTGGRVAAPIAQAVMEKVLAVQAAG